MLAVYCARRVEMHIYVTRCKTVISAISENPRAVKQLMCKKLCLSD